MNENEQEQLLQKFGLSVNLSKAHDELFLNDMRRQTEPKPAIRPAIRRLGQASLNGRSGQENGQNPPSGRGDGPTRPSNHSYRA